MNPSSPPPWMKFYVQDWLCSERLKHVPLAAHGLWINLLCIMHRSPKPGYLAYETPDGIRPLTLPLTLTLMGRGLPEIKPLWEILIKWGIMIQDENGFFLSKRMVYFHQHSMLLREKGKLGGNPSLMKKNSNSLKGRVKGDPLAGSDSESVSDVSLNGESEGFQKFWSLYPNKKGKQDAKVAWEKGGCDEMVDELCRVVEVQSTWQDWTKSGGQFIPLPGSWIRGRRWEDQPRGAVRRDAPI